MSQSTSSRSRRIATQPVTIPKVFLYPPILVRGKFAATLIDNDRSWCKPDREAEGEPQGVNW